MIKIYPAPLDSTGVWAEDAAGTPSGSAFAAYLMDFNAQLNSLSDDVATFMYNFKTLTSEIQKVKVDLDELKNMRTPL